MRLQQLCISSWRSAGAFVLVLFLSISGGVTAQGPGQGESTPAPGPIVPSLTDPTISSTLPGIEALAEAVMAENLEWDNITFWSGDPLGDDRLIPLMIDIPIGDRFPGFVTTRLQGSTFALGAVAAPTLVNFWASWCGPCRDELPFLLAMHQAEDTPFDVVLLNSWEEEEAYRTFAEVEFPETLISGRAPDELVTQIGLQAIPISVLLDTNQRVLAVHVGNITEAVVDLFYALAGAPAASLLEDTPQDTRPVYDLEVLAQEVATENLQAGASTAWEGGLLGLDEPLHMALQLGTKIPAFGLTTRSGDVFQLDLIHRPAMINFWASWCGPCVDEFPLLIEAGRANLPFDVIFVNIWDDPYTYEAFLAGYSSDITVMIDVNGIIPQQYDFEFVPITVLVDEDGIIRLIQRGPVSEAVIEFATALLQ